MLRAGLAGDHSRNRNSLSPVMQKHLCQTLLFTLVETYGAWRVGVVAPLDAAKAESRGGCLWGNRGRAGNGAASQKRADEHDVRVTPNSDRESEIPQKAMSALPPKADMCSARGNVR
jgi:hypothetical protein